MISLYAIHLGFIMLPWPLVIAVLSLIFAFLIARFLKAKYQLNAAQWLGFKDNLWTAVLIGLLFARLGFVLLNLDIYISQPLAMVQIQDKGFMPWPGIVAALIWLIWKNRALAKPWLAAFILSAGLSFIAGYGLWQTMLAQYQQFPAITLTTLEQQNFSLQQLAGKPTVINLWASWCPPCHREMPVLAQAQQHYPHVQFVMINQGEEAAGVQAYLARQNLEFKHVLIDLHGQAAEQTGMYGLPSSLFFNAQGQLMSTHMGELSQAVLKQKILAMTKE